MPRLRSCAQSTFQLLSPPLPDPRDGCIPISQAPAADPPHTTHPRRICHTAPPRHRRHTVADTPPRPMIAPASAPASLAQYSTCTCICPCISRAILHLHLRTQHLRSLHHCPTTPATTRPKGEAAGAAAVLTCLAQRHTPPPRTHADRAPIPCPSAGLPQSPMPQAPLVNQPQRGHHGLATGTAPAATAPPACHPCAPGLPPARAHIPGDHTTAHTAAHPAAHSLK